MKLDGPLIRLTAYVITYADVSDVQELIAIYHEGDEHNSVHKKVGSAVLLLVKSSEVTRGHHPEHYDQVYFQELEEEDVEANVTLLDGVDGLGADVVTSGEQDDNIVNPNENVDEHQGEGQHLLPFQFFFYQFDGRVPDLDRDLDVLQHAAEVKENALEHAVKQLAYSEVQLIVVNVCERVVNLLGKKGTRDAEHDDVGYNKAIDTLQHV